MSKAVVFIYLNQISLLVAEIAQAPHQSFGLGGLFLFIVKGHPVCRIGDSIDLLITCDMDSSSRLEGITYICNYMCYVITTLALIFMRKLGLFEYVYHPEVGLEIYIT